MAITIQNPSLISRSPEAHREARQRAAQARLADAQGRTPEQQLARLDARLGVGVGAVEERDRLQKAIQARQPVDQPKKNQKNKRVS